MKSKALKYFLTDMVVCIVAASFVATAFHYFANFNKFAPGGISGIASMTAYLTKKSMAYFVIIYNLPIIIATYFLIKKKTAVMITMYLSFQALFLFLLEKNNVPYYKADDNLIFAAIGTGLVSGVGYSLMLKRFGASGGTYTISVIIKRFKPDKSVAWVSFYMDVLVVFLSIFVYNFKIESIMCTLINLFIANMVVDYVLSGLKKAIKFEIITDKPNEISREIIEKLDAGITKIEATGNYSGEKKQILICLVRRRHVGEFMRILKKYDSSFSYMSQVNEVFGFLRG